MGLKHYSLQLADSGSGKSITDTGGVCYVSVADSALKATLVDKNGASASNPVALTNGKIEFYTADTVASVDLYGQAPKGQGFISKGVAASGQNEIFLNSGAQETTLVIPFAVQNQTGDATETDTGFDLPTNAVVSPFGSMVDISVLDATETIDVGVLSSESGGDADGLMALIALDSAVSVFPGVVVTSNVWASTTFGVLLREFTAGTNSDDRGLFSTKQYRCNGTAKSISYTLTTGSDTAKGFIKLKMALPVI